MNTEFTGSGLVGSNRIEFVGASYVNTPVITAAVPAVLVSDVRMNVSSVMVNGFIDSLNVMMIVVSKSTPEARFGGVVDSTTGQIPVMATFSSLQLPITTRSDRKAIVRSVFMILYLLS